MFPPKPLHSGRTLAAGMDMVESQAPGMDARAIQAALEVWGLYRNGKQTLIYRP